MNIIQTIERTRHSEKPEEFRHIIDTILSLEQQYKKNISYYINNCKAFYLDGIEIEESITLQLNNTLDMHIFITIPK